MPSAAITSKGQVTIPKPVRDRLNLKTGDRLDFVFEGDQVILKPATGDLRSLRGLLKRPRQKPVSLQAMEDSISQYHRRER